MALTDCTECGKTVSDKAATCPQCGAPVAPIPEDRPVLSNPNAADTHTRRTSPIIVVGGLLVVALLVIFVKPRFFPPEPSAEELGDAVKLMIQQKFDSDPAFSKFGLKVERVLAIKEGENRYQGIATIRHDGEAHEVPVEIISGPDRTMWKIDPGAMLFVAQREWQKAFQNR
jgi:zinc-ribbon domain